MRDELGCWHHLMSEHIIDSNIDLDGELSGHKHSKDSNVCISDSHLETLNSLPSVENVFSSDCAFVEKRKII